MATRLTDELSVLAATRAALDPNRSRWQHDILLSTIIELLERKGPLTQRNLHEQLKQTWIAREVNATLLTTALEAAQGDDLVRAEKGPKGKRTWSLTEAVRAEAQGDKQWARSILRELQADVEARLQREFPENNEVTARAPSLTKQLVRAMVRASRNVFQAVQDSASPQDLRGVRLNLRAVIPDLRATIDRPEVADVLADLILAAADPDERLGNELLRAIVAGQILHGMLCRADLSVPPPRTKLVLDTSQLLALCSHEHKVVELFTDFLETAHRHGCELVVTDRVLEEWDAQWRAAEEQEQALRRRFGDDVLDMFKLQNLAVLVSYAYAASEERALTFGEFASARRNLKPVIARYSIRVIDTSAEEFDMDFVNAFAEAIASSIEDSGRLHMRPEKQRTTDGVSAALVRRSRIQDEQTLSPSAWFVASDHHADEAYKAMTGDEFPLVASARTWMLYYSAFDPDRSKNSRAELADRLSEDLILEAFLSVASAYTPDEMLDLGDLLSEGDHLDREDVREAVRQNFLHPADGVSNRAQDLARARIQRQSSRALRTRELEGKKERLHENEMFSAKKQIQQLEESVRLGGAATERSSRKVHVAVVLAAAYVLLILLSTASSLPLGTLLVLWAAGVTLLPFEAVKYVQDVRRPRWVYVSELGSTLVLAVAGLFIG